MPAPTTARRILRWAVGLGIATAALLIAVAGLINTPWGKEAIANTVSRMASSDVRSVHISGLHGFLPASIGVDAIQVAAPDDTPWLMVEGAEVDWSPWALLRGRIRIHTVAAARIRLDRMPPRREDKEPFRLPNLPEIVRTARLGAVAIDRFELGEAVAGEAAVFRVTGHAQPGGKDTPQTLDLGLERLDAPTPRGTVRAGLDAANTLSIDLEARDEVFVARLLGKPELGPAEVRLHGTGPLEDWTGEFEATLGGTPVCSATFSLGVSAPIEWACNASISLDHSAFPPMAAGRVGPRVVLDAAGTRDGSRFTLSHAAITSDGLRVEVSGSFDRETGSGELHLDTEIAQFGRLAGLAQPEFNRTARLRVRVAGALDAPEFRAEADFDGARILGIEAARVSGADLAVQGRFGIVPVEPQVPAPWVQVLGPAIDGTFSIARAADGGWAVRNLAIDTASAHMEAGGTINPGGQQMDVTWRVAGLEMAQLAPVSPTLQNGHLEIEGAFRGDASGWHLDGRVSGADMATATARAARAALAVEARGAGWVPSSLESLEATLNGTVDGLEANGRAIPVNALALDVRSETPHRIVLDALALSGGGFNADGSGAYDLSEQTGHLEMAAVASAPAELASALGLPQAQAIALEQLLGNRAQLVARGERGAGGMVRLDGVAFEGRSIQAQAGGTYTIESNTLDMALEADVTDVQPLSAFVGRPLAGAYRITATAAGPADAFAADVQLTARDAAVAGVAADGIRGVATLTGLPRVPRGRAEMTFTASGTDITARTEFALESARLTVPALSIACGPNTLTASLSADLAARSVAGQLDATLDGLDAFAPFVSARIAGRGAMAAEFAVNPDEIVVNATGSLAAFTSPYGTLDGLEFSAEATGPPRGIAGAGQITLSRYQRGELRIDRGTLEVTGSTELAQITAAFDGATPTVPEARVTAEAAVSAAERHLRVTALDVRAGDHAVALTEPLVAALQNDGAVIEPFTLTLSGGTLRGGGRITGDRVDAECTLAGIPLAVAELAGQAPVQGRADGTITLSGFPMDPRLDADIQLAGVAPAGAAETADVALRVRLADGGSTLEGTLRAGAGIDASVQAAVPVAFRINPFEFSVANDAPLRGAIESRADLAAIPLLLGEPRHVMAGTFDGAFDFAGSIRAPRVAGQATIRDARYENAQTGTILNGLTADLEAEGRRITLTKARATDGTSGSIEAAGHLDVDPAAGFPFDITATFTKARLVHRDDVSGRVDGPVAAQGSLRGIDVSGQLTLGPARVRIPERLPPSVAQVEFQEVDETPDGMKPAAPPARPAPSAVPIRLDLTCKAPGGIVVLGPSLESEWRGDLAIRGTAQAPAVTGTLSSVRGNLVFLDRNFAIEPSRIALDGSWPPSPFLDIAASSETRDLTAYLRLTGEYPDIALEMRSEPALPQDEILAKLLFDRDLSTIGPVQALKLARTAQALGRRQGGLAILSGPPQVPGLGNLSVGESAAGDTTLGVGTDLTERIYLEVQQGIGASGTRATVEYRITPELSIEAEVESTTRSKAGIYWQKDY